MENNIFIEITQIICGNDECLLDKVREYILYNEEHISEKSEIWIGFVELLEENNYVCERDWKDEIEDFIYFFENTNGVKQLGLEIHRDWFDKSDGIPEWCEILDEKWESLDCCAAAIDIESDSYVLFACRTTALEELKNMASQIDCKIDYAKKM